MGEHVRAMLDLQKRRRGHLRLRQQHPRAGRRRPAWPTPSISPASSPPTSGRSSARARARSAGRCSPATRPTSRVTDEAVLRTFPDDAALQRWITLARERVAFQGLPARICWLGYGERAKMGAVFNELVRTGAGQRAHRHRARPSRRGIGGLAQPRDGRDADGSDAVADWPILNALLNAVAGATWVSVHHGGGVGMGYSHPRRDGGGRGRHPGAAARLQRVLTTDPGTGVIRHADAGYPRALEVARGARSEDAPGAPEDEGGVRARRSSRRDARRRPAVLPSSSRARPAPARRRCSTPPRMRWPRRAGGPSPSTCSPPPPRPSDSCAPRWPRFPTACPDAAAARAREAEQLAQAGRAEGARAVQALLSVWAALDTVDGRPVVLLLDEPTEIRSLAYFSGLREVDGPFGAALAARPRGTILATAFPGVARKLWPQLATFALPTLSPPSCRPRPAARPARGRVGGGRVVLRVAALRALAARPPRPGPGPGRGLGAGDGAGRGDRAGLPPHLRGAPAPEPRLRHVEGRPGRGGHRRGAEPDRAGGAPRPHAGSDPGLPRLASRGGRPARGAQAVLLRRRHDAALGPPARARAAGHGRGDPRVRARGAGRGRAGARRSRRCPSPATRG